jgi:hypothetical protein
VLKRIIYNIISLSYANGSSYFAKMPLLSQVQTYYH